jgi:hypothetical protein
MEMYWLKVSGILIWACYSLCPYKEMSQEAMNDSDVAINSHVDFTPYMVLRGICGPIILGGNSGATYRTFGHH